MTVSFRWSQLVCRCPDKERLCPRNYGPYARGCKECIRLSCQYVGHSTPLFDKLSLLKEILAERDEKEKMR